MIHLRPACPYPHRRATVWALVEEVEVSSLHDVLAIRARRAASFATAMPGLRTEPCYLRVAQRTPRTGRHLPRHPRRRMRRGLLKSCATGSATTLVVPGAPMEKPLRITLKMRGAKIHINTPVEAACGCRTVTVLLLTQLGV